MGSLENESYPNGPVQTPQKVPALAYKAGIGKYAKPMGKFPNIIQAKVNEIGKCGQFNIEMTELNDNFELLHDQFQDRMREPR